MMLDLLRKVDQRIRALEALESLLKEYEVHCLFTSLSEDTRYIVFKADNQEWILLFPLSQLVNLVSPELTGANIPEQVIKASLNLITTNFLLDVCNIDIIPFHKLAYHICEDISMYNSLTLLKVWNDHILFYINKAPLLKKNSDFRLPLYYDIIFPLKIVIGSSEISIHDLEKINEGDVLLLGNICPECKCNNVIIEITKWPEEIIMLNQYNGESQVHVAPPSAEDNNICDLAQLKVKVEIVMCAQSLTLKELHELKEHKTLVLPPKSHENIYLMINDHFFAKGELVQIGDNLAVEINLIKKEP